jgi:alkylation response protein AidB-like acyl-CoA dehydrogenase
VNFGLSEEQQVLQGVFRSYLGERLPATRVREVSDAGAPQISRLWAELASLGAAGVLIPEELGGSGLGLLDAALVAEELGRAVAPVPFLSTAVMGPVALLEAGTPEQKQEWLPKIAGGAVRIGVAATETFSRREGARVALARGRIHGSTLMALDAETADAFLVAAGGSDLLLVPADAAGLTLSPLPTVDRTRRFAELVFDAVAPAEVLGGPGGAAHAIERMLDAGRVALIGDVVGACDEMLARAVEYAGQRKQFGRVIGSFQAVKHLCAEMAAEVEPSRSLFWYAAHAFDRLPDEAPLIIAHARAHVSEVGTFVARTSTEVHGGVGFTDEQNLHLWFKRIGVDRQLLGGPVDMRERAARLQGWPSCASM